MGRVLRPHGLRGELRVEGFNPVGPNLQAGCTVFIKGVRGRILRSRSDRGAWIVEVSSYRDRSAVEGLQGFLVEARDADVKRDDADSYFVHELIGLRVLTDTGKELGAITEVMQTGAADVYVVTKDGEEALIPAIADVVQSIDLKLGEVRITPLPGLLDKSK